MMKIQAYQTARVELGDDLEKIIIAGLPQKLTERSVVVITSKIISLCENNAVKIPKDPNEAKLLETKLIAQDSEKYCSGSRKYEVLLGWRDGHLSARAGIDRLNTGGYFVLWPDDLQASANRIWQFLREYFKLEKLGVIVSDSHVQMGRWGVIGTALSHCGFLALNNSIGKEDLFGEKFMMTHVAVSEALAVAAVYEMGETNERTPIAVISKLDNVVFQDRVPNEQELQDFFIELEDDLMADFLTGPDWKIGERAKK